MQLSTAFDLSARGWQKVTLLSTFTGYFCFVHVRHTCAAVFWLSVQLRGLSCCLAVVAAQSVGITMKTGKGDSISNNLYATKSPHELNGPKAEKYFPIWFAIGTKDMF